jgi:membrane-associated protein
VITPDLGQLSMATLYLVVFTVIFVESGILVGLVLPGDSVLFVSGLLAARNGTPVSLAILVITVFAAATLGDTVGYGLGRRLGRGYLDRPRRLRSRRWVERAERLYDRHGWFAVVIARWYPWIRTIMPVLAGIGRMPYGRFVAANALGAVLWGCGIVVLGYLSHSIPGLYQASLVAMGLAILATLGYLARQWRQRRRSTDADVPA